MAPLPLPSKSPELNLVENIWQYMRDNWLSNRVFTSYDDILDHCCKAWDKLIENPWIVMSIRIAPMGVSVLISGIQYKGLGQ